jgi:hypothetical protein
MTEAPRGNIDILLDVTITSLGLFYLENLCEYALKRRLRVRGRIAFKMLNSPFSVVSFVDKKLREQVVEQFNSYYQSQSEEDKELLRELWEVMPLVVQEDDMTKEELRECENAIKVYDKLYPEFRSYSDYLKDAVSSFGSRYGQTKLVI